MAGLFFCSEDPDSLNVTLGERGLTESSCFAASGLLLRGIDGQTMFGNEKVLENPGLYKSHRKYSEDKLSCIFD